jgi:hypothetical protein
MISMNITPLETKVVIEIPEELVNKQLHVEIREECHVEEDEKNIEELRAFFKPFQRDMSNFRLNREELHER